MSLVVVKRHTLLQSYIVSTITIQNKTAYGVLTISAPKARSITSFSRLILAGRVIIHAYPLSAQAIAKPIPTSQFCSGRVLYNDTDLCCRLRVSHHLDRLDSLVGSTTILFPGVNVPSFSASSTILCRSVKSLDRWIQYTFAILSFTDPPAEKYSHFATTHQRTPMAKTISDVITYVDYT